ncbi:MAG: hypothetical protein HC890_10040 [Chloroflexaceae bacterium]|nr:hypothetical protein [Chloroflexaceae bacterium]
MGDNTRGVNPSNSQTGTNRSVTGTPQQQTLNDNDNRRVYENDRSINERDADTTNNNNQPVRGLW